MAESNLVSVIVPVFNVENYVDECICSLVKQTYSNIEIILVDDGSSDASLDICRKWAKKDPRIKLYSNENRGVSYTRNFAIQKSEGELITFLDSDDIVSEKYVEILTDLIKRDNSDIAVTSYSCFCDNQTPEFKISSDKKVVDRNIECAFFDFTSGIVWGKIYKRKIIEDNNIKFDENIAVTEDLLFNFQYAKYCRQLSYNNSSLYGYRQRANSAIHNTASQKWFTCLTTYKYLSENYKHHVVYPKIVYHYLKNLYEANYLIKHKDIWTVSIDIDIEDEIKKAEQDKHLVSLKGRIKLFICKYFFGIVELTRR